MADTVIQQNITCPEGTNVFTRVYIAKHLQGMDHIRVFSDALLDIALDEELTGQDFRVLLAILGEMEYENFYRKSQQALGDLLGLKQTNVGKSVRKLVAKGWLRIDGQIGRRNVYRVNPHLAFKSRAKNHKLLVEEWDFVPMGEAQ